MVDEPAYLGPEGRHLPPLYGYADSVGRPSGFRGEHRQLRVLHRLSLHNPTGAGPLIDAELPRWVVR